MPIDDRTTNRSYQLPNVSNFLTDDVARLRAALQAIDADVFARYTKTEVDTLINELINGAPAALNTLQELAVALGNDANYAATVTTALSNRYTKTESDTLLALKANIADVTSLLLLKANSADVYTKTQSDGRYLQSVPNNSVSTPQLTDGAVTRIKVGESLIVKQSAVATQSGTFKDFTNIPSWARRVTLLLYGVSTNGASDLLIQLGSSATPLSSGYMNCQSIFMGSGTMSTSTSSAGIPIYNNSVNSAFFVWTGRIVMEQLEPGIHNWVVTATMSNTVNLPGCVISNGVAPLTAPLSMVRLTTALGTPTFDAGYASISWE